MYSDCKQIWFKSDSFLPDSPLRNTTFQVLFHLGIQLAEKAFLGDFPGACVHRDQEKAGLGEILGDAVHLAQNNNVVSEGGNKENGALSCCDGLTVMKELLSPLSCSLLQRDLTCVWR